MRRKAVVLLLDYSPKSWSSREEFHYRLSKRLVERGIQPVLVHAHALPAEVDERMRSSGARTIGQNYSGKPGPYRKLLDQLSHEYEVVAAHIRYFDYFSLVPWVARASGIRNIVFTECNGGLSNARGWKRALLLARTKLVTAPLRKGIAISDFIKGRMESVGIARHKLVRIYNGVDNDRFSPNQESREWLRHEFALPADAFVVSTVSALTPIKNVRLLVEAFGQANLPAHFFVGGYGPLRDELEQLGHQLGVGDRIHWLGHCSYPDKLIAASDVFWLGTTGEAFGLVIAEAMACGVPVIGGNAGAVAELIQDGKTGVLAEAGNPASFADALTRLHADPDLRNRMGEQSVTRVRDHFSIDVSVSQTMAVYDSIWGNGA